jgi:hypothetical protein
MISVLALHPPFDQKTRNIVSLKETFELSTAQAQVLFENIYNQDFPKQLADDFVEKLKMAGWRVHISTEELCEREKLQIDAKQWYDGLSPREKEFVAYFQRMMIPSAF